MNILIVGNGFDLSHYLPTKYDHFMDVMEAIESKETGGLPLNPSDIHFFENLYSFHVHIDTLFVYQLISNHHSHF